MSVLVVDDKPVLSGTVRDYLERADMSAQTCGDGLAAPDLARTTAPNAVVLDLGLPGMDGVEVCYQLRIFNDCYVLMFIACADKVDKLTGLSIDVDDYMIKPFNPRELVAHIQVLLRRPCAGSTGTTAVVVHYIGALTLDLSSCRAEFDASPVGLTYTGFDLLQALAEHPSWMLDRRQLTDVVWGGDWADDDHLVDTHIAHLHKKLGDDPFQPRFMQTVHGVDYRVGQRQ